MPKGVYLNRTKWSESTRRKIMFFLLEHKHSEETKEKIRIKALGRKHTKLSIKKMCLIHSKIGILKELRVKMVANIPKGEDCWNWKGGITPLRELIRNSFQFKQWRIDIFKKDNYTCQECFMCGVYVEAHHIKPFSIIFNEFLQQYSQFSPIEDKETLLRLATTYKPFWEVDNGKTLCKKCHDKINHYLLIPNMRNVNSRLLKNKAN